MFGRSPVGSTLPQKIKQWSLTLHCPPGMHQPVQPENRHQGAYQPQGLTTVVMMCNKSGELTVDLASKSAGQGQQFRSEEKIE